MITSKSDGEFSYFGSIEGIIQHYGIYSVFVIKDFVSDGVA